MDLAERLSNRRNILLISAIKDLLDEMRKLDELQYLIIETVLDMDKMKNADNLQVYCIQPFEGKFLLIKVGNVFRDNLDRTAVIPIRYGFNDPNDVLLFTMDVIPKMERIAALKEDGNDEVDLEKLEDNLTTFLNLEILSVLFKHP